MHGGMKGNLTHGCSKDIKGGQRLREESPPAEGQGGTHRLSGFSHLRSSGNKTDWGYSGNPGGRASKIILFGAGGQLGASPEDLSLWSQLHVRGVSSSRFPNCPPSTPELQICEGETRTIPTLT